jgi:hypothetical protein
MFQPSNPPKFSDKSQPELSKLNSVSKTQEISNHEFSNLDNQEQTFKLIDSFLSLRHCLFYQVLPLKLKDNCLTLGMVNPSNQQALTYINSLLANRNYELKTQQIGWQTLQSIVLAYSNNNRTNKNNQNHQKEKNETTSTSTETKIAQSIEQLETKLLKRNPLQDRPTLIINSPQSLNLETVNSIASKISNLTSKDGQKSDADNGLLTVPALEVQAIYLDAPVEFLTTLSPQLLWRELLGRILGAGIGKLTFDRQQDYGQIILSCNGVKQLSIQKLDLSIFQSVLSEFKYLAKLPATPIQELRRGELLRSYKQERLLLSWQINPSQYGEFASLHVLRGNALEFYQKKQMDDLSEQALQLTKTLESKLQQIQAIREMNPTPIAKIASLLHAQKSIQEYLQQFQQS